MNILLCPPKIIFQHSVEEWNQLQAHCPLVIATCASQEAAINKYLGEDFSLQYFENFNDNPLVELALYQFAAEHPVKGIHYLAEIDVLRASRISDRLALTQGREQAAIHFRNKYLMKSLVQRHHLAIPPMALVDSATAISRFIAEHGYPCVLKPNDGRGSQGVVVIKNQAQLHACLQQLTPLHFHNLLVEKFIKGEAWQINGLYLQGKPQFISASRATVSCLDFLSGSTLGLVMADNTPLHQKLIAYTRFLAEEVFPTEPDALLHLEVFVDENENIIFGELASRLGGCYVNEELGAAFGLDPRMTWLNAVINQHYPQNLEQRAPVRQVGQLNMPPRQGVLKAQPENCPLPYVVKYRATGIVDHHYQAMKLTNGEIISAIVEGENSVEIENRLNALAHWVNTHSSWQ